MVYQEPACSAERIILSPCISIMYFRICRLWRFSSGKDLLKYDAFPLQDYDVGQRLDRYLKNTEIGWISAQKYLREKDILVLTADGEWTGENNYRIK